MAVSPTHDASARHHYHGLGFDKKEIKFPSLGKCNQFVDDHQELADQGITKKSCN
jgi:hypothetical protein